MLNAVLEFLVGLWKVKIPWQEMFLPKKPMDVIACVSYGLDKNRRLARFTEAACYRALMIAYIFPHAPIVFGGAVFAPGSGVPDTSEEERELKMEIFERAGVKNKIIYAGRTLTTIDECERFRDALRANGISPRGIILVDGEAHSRSTRYIWRRIFPDVSIALSTINFYMETQQDQVMNFARKPALWLGANIARHILLRLFGIDFVRRFVQPAS